MDIAIIGAGNVGRALATFTVRVGHSVVISASDPPYARDTASCVGARAASSNTEAARPADIVILAVPVGAIDGIVDELGAALDGKVVDVTNRANPDDPGAVVDGTSTAETLQSRLPAARVVKAFNTAFASRQADPVVDGVPVDGYDAEAKRAVLQLVESMGSFHRRRPARHCTGAGGDGLAQHLAEHPQRLTRGRTGGSSWGRPGRSCSGDMAWAHRSTQTMITRGV